MTTDPDKKIYCTCSNRKEEHRYGPGPVRCENCGGAWPYRPAQEFELFYSHNDEGYIAVLKEERGLSAYGKTKREALTEFAIALELWEEIEKEDKRCQKKQ